MGTDPRRKSEYTAFIEPISWAKILDFTKKVSYRKRKIYKNLVVVGLEPCVSFAESIPTTRLI